MQRLRRTLVVLALAVVTIAAGTWGWWRLRSGEAPNGRGEAPVLAVIRVPLDAIAPLATTKVHNRRPVAETVVGTFVTGTSKVEATTSLKLLPDPHAAALEIVLDGTSTSDTSGEHGPVEIDSHTVQRFHATKRITVDRDGFHADPAAVEVHVVQSQSTPEAKAPGLRGRIVDRVAQRRIAQTKGEADRQTMDNTRRQVAESFDAAVDKRLDAINRRPLLRQLLDGKPTQPKAIQLELSTTDRELLIRLVIGDGPPGRGPELAQTPSPVVEIYVNYLEAARHLPMVIDTLDRLERHAAGRPEMRRVERQLSEQLTAKLRDLVVTADGRWVVVRLARFPRPAADRAQVAPAGPGFGAFLLR